jgi:hypothetical protein
VGIGLPPSQTVDGYRKVAQDRVQRTRTKLAAAGWGKGSPAGQRDHDVTVFAAISDDGPGAPKQAEQLVAGHPVRIYIQLR